MEQLLMSRGDTKIKAEEIQFPDGYYMRPYNKAGKSTDGVGWCKCCIGGSLGIEELSENVFEEKMLKDKTVNPGNIFFLISPAGDIAGTVTYQYADDEDTGYIHMVAIEKNHQGKRLAVPLMLYAVQKIIGDGKKKILLNTDDWRIPAIKTYLHTGFVPVIKDGDTDMENRWRKVYDIIGIK